MRFRECSETGYLMQQIMGAICLPYVTRDAQKRDEFRQALWSGRKSGKSKEIFDQLTEGLFIDRASLHPAQQRAFNRTRADTDSAKTQTRSPGPAPVRAELSDVDRRVPVPAEGEE